MVLTVTTEGEKEGDNSAKGNELADVGAIFSVEGTPIVGFPNWVEFPPDIDVVEGLGATIF